MRAFPGAGQLPPRSCRGLWEQLNAAGVEGRAGTRTSARKQSLAGGPWTSGSHLAPHLKVGSKGIMTQAPRGHQLGAAGATSPQEVSAGPATPRYSRGTTETQPHHPLPG